MLAIGVMTEFKSLYTFMFQSLIFSDSVFSSDVIWNVQPNNIAIKMLHTLNLF